MKRSILLGAMALALLCGPVQAATVVSPSIVGTVDASGTVTTGGVYQTVQAYNSNRLNCTVQNPGNASEVLSVKIGPMAQPYVLTAGESISTLNATINTPAAITLTAPTTGHAYAATCQQ